MKPLTAKQLQCLRDAEAAMLNGGSLDERCISGWDYGSTTIATLKREGLIIRAYTAWSAASYFITEKGRQVLETVKS